MGAVHEMAERRERRIDPLAEPLDAAEVAQAGRDLQQHGVRCRAGLLRRLHRHVGRDGECGVGDGQQRVGVAPGIGLAEHDVRCQGQRGRLLQPGLDPERQGCRIGTDDAVRLEQGDRPRRRTSAAGNVAGGQCRRERFERQPGQMQGDPEHGKDEDEDEVDSGDKEKCERGRDKDKDNGIESKAATRIKPA